MMHNFYERLAFSEGVALEQGLIEHLLDSIPGSIRIVRADEPDDKSGVDYWIERRGLPPVGIDVKHRDIDPIERWNSDDACIETTSVYGGPPKPPWLDENRRKPGWTIDGSKRTDLIVYTWPAPQGHRRFWVLYFPHLCRAAQENWRQWARQYGEKPAMNDGYLTLCVYPPRRVIAEAMRKYTLGVY
jgi:hypothetical protein